VRKREQQVMIAAYKSHIGFYPYPVAIKHFSIEFKKYKIGKGSVQIPIPINKPLSMDVVIRIEYGNKKPRS